MKATHKITIAKTTKKIFTFLLFIFFFTNLFAKESSVAKDVKKALGSYAGMSELKKRGFNIKSLDKAETLEDVYNTMLPYMIQNGVPLDNAIGFYDKQTYQTYSFKQHYSVNFTDDYGTKEELLKKGYKEDEIFAYFSKGPDVYRGGRFEWQKAKNYPEFGQWMMPHFPPVTDEQFIYFWPAYWTEKFYPDYWEQAAQKNFIIIDLRFDMGDAYPISQFFDYLDKVKYQGQVIIIMDASSAAGEELYCYRMTTWSNGQEKPRTFRYVSIGENTIGLQNFSDWKRYETDNSIIWGVRQKKNQWKKYDEGVGVIPDVWAENADDIFKSVEVLTGLKDFSKQVEVYQKYIDILTVQNQNSYNKFEFPESLVSIKDDKLFIKELSNYIDYYYINIENRIKQAKYNLYFPEFPYKKENFKNTQDYNDNYSKYIELQNKWFDFCINNSDKSAHIESSLFYNFTLNQNNLSVQNYFTRLSQVIDSQILLNKKAYGELTETQFNKALQSILQFNSDVKEPNRQLESAFLIFNKFDVMVSQGFDIHKLDYVKTPEEIINYLQPFFLSKDGYPLDLHSNLTIKTHKMQNYKIQQTSRYIEFTNEYGSKNQLEKKGYIADKTMFYYPFHDGKFWNGKNDWRVGKQIMAMPNNSFQESEHYQKYYTTNKTVYMKFWNFPKKTGDNPELDEMIKNLAEEKNKENVIFDITNNLGGVSRPAEEIRSAVQKSGIKNVYVIYGKNSFSMADHFALQAKTYFFSDKNCTTVGYPTKGASSSGVSTSFTVEFPDFTVTITLAADGHGSETKYEGWGATPDIYADNLEDALGAIRGLTGDNQIQPFESEEYIKRNEGKKRWLEDDIIFEIKD